MFGIQTRRKLRLIIQRQAMEIDILNGKLQKKEQENQRLTAVVEIKCKEVDRVKKELRDAMDLINDPPFFRPGQQIGSIRILQILRNEDSTTDIFLPWLALGLGILSLWVVGRHPMNALGEPVFRGKQSSWKYRYFDFETQREYELSEEELKETAWNETIV